MVEKIWGGQTLNQQALSSFLWSVAGVVRGDYQQADYRKVVLMRGGKASIKVRGALKYYALSQLAFDTDPGAKKQQYQQIVLLNREVIHEDHG